MEVIIDKRFELLRRIYSELGDAEVIMSGLYAWGVPSDGAETEEVVEWVAAHVQELFELLDDQDYELLQVELD